MNCETFHKHKKTRTALEAGSYVNQVLDMPRPMGTPIQEKYRERSKRTYRPFASSTKMTKYALFKKAMSRAGKGFQEANGEFTHQMLDEKL